jgi:hypothetical protein
VNEKLLQFIRQHTQIELSQFPGNAR